MRLWILCAAVLSPAGLSRRRDSMSVPAGANLQQAIDRARPGDTLLLDARRDLHGQFRAAGEERAIATSRFGPRETETASRGSASASSPVHAPRLAKLKSPNKEPVLRTAAGAHHWRLQLVEFLPTDDRRRRHHQARRRRRGAARAVAGAARPRHRSLLRARRRGGSGRSAASRSTARRRPSRIPTSPTSRPSGRTRRRLPAGTVPVPTRSRTTTSKARARTSSSADRIRPFPGS